MNGRHIRDIIQDQAVEKQKISGNRKLIERENLAHWKRFIDSEPVKVTTGVRRSGKSTFTHLLLSDRDYAYVNFDDERLSTIGRMGLNDVLEALYGQYGDFKYLLMDEVQNVEGWELFVNRLQRSGIRTCVTGSNANLLGRELATHLTGRALPIEMLPFSFTEFLLWNGIDTRDTTTRGKAVLKKALEDYMKIGGFPEVVKEPDMARDYLNALYSSIITKDILARREIKYVRTFKEIASTLLSSFSNLMTYNKLKNTHGLKSVHTAKNYVDFLAEAYLVQILDKFSPKPKEIANSPKKVYVIDTGLIGVMSRSVSENLGGLMENLVFLQLLRKKSLESDLELFFWNDYQDHEIDFVLRKGKRIEELIQVTYASEPADIMSRETGALVKGAGLLGCKKLTIITWDHEGRLRKNGTAINCIPLWKWLLGFPALKIRD